MCVCRKARKVVEDVAREQVLAAKINGLPPSVHVFLTPDSDGDEATVVSADIVAGRSYVHKIDAVLVPKSMLRFLEITSDKKFKKPGKKASNLTVAEALKGSNGTNSTNSTAGNKTKDGNATKGGPGAADAAAASKGVPGARNGTKAASGAAEMMFTAAIGLPSLLLAALMVL